MKKYIVIIILLLPCFIGFSQSESNYFYTFNQKVEIKPVANKVSIKPDKDVSSKVSSDPLSFFSLSKTTSRSSSIRNGMHILESDKTSISRIILNAKQTAGITVNPVYVTNEGIEIAIWDEIVVKFKNGVSINQIDDVAKKFGLTKVKENRLYTVFQVLKQKDLIETANIIQESGLVDFSYPNFYMKPELHRFIPNDTYFSNQITLHNVGQVFTDGHSGNADADIDAPEAWDITMGSNNIIVAVLDQGVTSNHPDLPNTRQVRLNGSNFGSGDPNDPSPTANNNHGNACAGVIAATINNNEGIAGVAPNCRIMPLRWDEATTSQDLADAITFAVDNGARIISNSWGYNSTNPNLVPAIVTAIQDAINRNCVVLFSAGNTADHNAGYNGYITFPSNVNIGEVITVGASDRYDLQSNYSPTSNTSSSNNQIIDICAPSHRAYSCQIANETFEMWSLDMPGSAGYNPVKDTDCGSLPVVGSYLPTSGTNYLAYTGRFGGTSHACPVVAGVAALILSINPNLTPQQVFNIITSSSNDVGGYTYTNGWSAELGHGRVNAFNAVMTSCPNNYNITWTMGNGDNLEYQAGNYITAQNIINSGAIIEYHAGNSVRLTSGFHAYPNSSFKAYLQACGTVVKSARIDNSNATIENENLTNVNEANNNQYANGNSKDFSLDKIIVYPNPAKDKLFIKGLENFKAEIYDITGRMVFLNNSVTNSIDLSRLKNGVYILHLKCNGKTIIKRITKQ
jgi:subtilisin family serine protease